MDKSTQDRVQKSLGLVALFLASLGLFAAACGSTTVSPMTGEVDREELVNPAEDGEEMLANLPETNPPLGAGDPKIVGSQDMTREEFAQVIGSDLNAKWQSLFEGGGYAYSNAGLYLYEAPIPITGCGGVADPEMGPAYCSDNQTIYYPLTWTDRSGRTPAQVGDFAVAVVLAHEVGHHVQNLSGTFQNPNFYTIQLELQADCLAGIWGRSVFEEGSLESDDVGEALELMTNAADLPGTPATDPGAHGTDAQRIDAFFTGYESGDAGQCQF
jgi:predicted metalloprotease